MYVTHGVMDAWSVAALLKELGQRYNGLRAGSEQPVVAAFALFDFGLWYENLLQRAELQESRSDWVLRLGDQSRLELPQTGPRSGQARLYRRHRQPAL